MIEYTYQISKCKNFLVLPVNLLNTLYILYKSSNLDYDPLNLYIIGKKKKKQKNCFINKVYYMFNLFENGKQTLTDY